MDKQMILWRRIGNRIADMRMSRGISQMRLAEMIGVSRVFIGYIEQGKRSATIQTYLDIVTALGYTLDDLMREDLSDTAPGLMLELNNALMGCSEDERESVVRIFREMLHMIRQLKKTESSNIIE